MVCTGSTRELRGDIALARMHGEDDPRTPIRGAPLLKLVTAGIVKAIATPEYSTILLKLWNAHTSAADSAIKISRQRYLDRNKQLYSEKDLCTMVIQAVAFSYVDDPQ